MPAELARVGFNPATGRDAELAWRAEDDALRACINKNPLPDPAEVAGWLPPNVVEMLCAAWKHGGEPGWRIHKDDWPFLKRHGLACYVTPHLTAFGAQVRKVLMEGGGE